MRSQSRQPRVRPAGWECTCCAAQILAQDSAEQQNPIARGRIFTRFWSQWEERWSEALARVERSRCGITARGIFFSRVDCSVLFEGGRIIGRFSQRWLSEGSVGFQEQVFGVDKGQKDSVSPPGLWCMWSAGGTEPQEVTWRADMVTLSFPGGSAGQRGHVVALFPEGTPSSPAHISVSVWAEPPLSLVPIRV